MSLPIVIKTDASRAGFVGPCIEALGNRDAHVIKNASFELGGISRGLELGLDRFLFIQDTVIIKDADRLFELLESHETCQLLPRPGCYLGVYSSRILREMTIPTIPLGDKEAAITNETVFVDEYINTAYCAYGIRVPVIFPELTDGRALADENMKFHVDGLRLALENEVLVKFKGTFR